MLVSFTGGPHVMCCGYRYRVGKFTGSLGKRGDEQHQRGRAPVQKSGASKVGADPPMGADLRDGSRATWSRSFPNWAGKVKNRCDHAARRGSSITRAIRAICASETRRLPCLRTTPLSTE